MYRYLLSCFPPTVVCCENATGFLQLKDGDAWFRHADGAASSSKYVRFSPPAIQLVFPSFRPFFCFCVCKLVAAISNGTMCSVCHGLDASVNAFWCPVIGLANALAPSPRPSRSSTLLVALLLLCVLLCRLFIQSFGSSSLLFFSIS